jgi:glutamine synthetase type III
MKKTLSNILNSATVSAVTTSGLSIDSIVALITSISGKLRDVSKAKSAEAARVRAEIEQKQQQVRDLLDESDRAFRIAEQLDGLVL